MRNIVIFLILPFSLALCYVLVDFGRVFEKSSTILRNQTIEATVYSQIIEEVPKKVKSNKKIAVDPEPPPAEEIVPVKIEKLESKIESPLDTSVKEEKINRTGICHTYVVHCKDSWKKAIGYGTEKNPKTEQTDREITECITTQSHCMDEFQELSLEEEAKIINEMKALLPVENAELPNQ